MVMVTPLATIVFLVFVLTFVVIGHRVFTTFLRGPDGMIDDMMGRAERMHERMLEMKRRHEPQDWTCSHCDRTNPPEIRECDSCGAPKETE